MIGPPLPDPACERNGRVAADVVAATVSTPASPANPVYVKPPLPKNRLGWRVNHIKARWSACPGKRRLAWAAPGAEGLLLGELLRPADEALTAEDAEGRRLAAGGRARGGESLDKLLPEALGLGLRRCQAVRGHAAVRRAATLAR
ncbi:MAG: hypothetical protein U0797_19400 [Gemmataceae bacterium]